MPKLPRPLIAAIAPLALVAACSSSGGDGGGASPAAGHGKPDVALLSAAGEAFEALTEQAFTASPLQAAALLGDAEAAVMRLAPQLDPAVASDLSGEVATARTALADHRPADAALAAVEGYRKVITLYPPDTAIPPQVSLMDYAGFRIQADLRAKPARWDDVTRALSFGNSQWLQIAPQVTDASLAEKVDSSLKAIQTAQVNGDLAGAQKATAAELDLVDELERFFTNAAEAAPKG